jgi:hypothetical protein
VPDSAWRDRQVGASGERMRQVRLVASLTDLGAPAPTQADNPPGKD